VFLAQALVVVDAYAEPLGAVDGRAEQEGVGDVGDFDMMALQRERLNQAKGSHFSSMLRNR
jgi:hypothetical protein